MASEPSANEQIPIGCVHGRFQPFHLGHLEYVIAGYKRSKLLYIGLANADPSQIIPDPTAPLRHLPQSNPFKYFERMEMVLGSLHEAKLELSRIRIVPFPINRPELLAYYVPSSTVHFITIYDEWGEQKLRKLLSLHAKVEVLWRRSQKLTTGGDIRVKLSRGETVEGLVPPFVAVYLKSVRKSGEPPQHAAL